MSERWMPIPGYGGMYEASDLGRVRSLFRGGRVLKPVELSDGYLGFGLSKPGGAQRVQKAHRLIAETFIRPPAPGEVVNHLDFNKHNNAVQNLEWTTQGGNVRHSQRAGRLKPARLPGELNPRAKITEADVLEIRQLRGKVSQRLLAIRFGVTKTAIRYAQQGRNWKCIREFPRV